MSSSDPTPVSTPKRKRSQREDDDTELPSYVTATFSPANIALPSSSPTEDGSTSPRTKVAHRFRSLAIGRPRAFAEQHTTARFVLAPRDVTATIPETPQPGSRNTSGNAAQDDDVEMDYGARKRVKLPQDRDPEPDTAVDKDPPGIPQARPRSKTPPIFTIERPGTPPLKKSTPITQPASTGGPSPPPPPVQPTPAFQWPPSPPDTADSTEAMTVAFRASMTWHEDEITIYDPDDSDDDGTGINGIGFKPTPAVAYARGVKRKQQLAEYRKREEREARARRSQRRRGTASPRAGSPRRSVVSDASVGGSEKGEKEKEKLRRRVRFMEASNVGPAAVATSS
ncbi:hypothetical protein GE09DRAFT_218809 [Coniochaeta sp. 2T2.1]|nr:hypothetical protein GE09DRAFT_218809 [Coniochaeta sp. 2T2.1]